MKTRLSHLLLGVLLAAGLVAVARADDDTTTATVKLSNPAKPSTLRINMPWADIHIAGADGDTVTVESTLARKDNKSPRPGGLRRLDDEVTFELTEHDNVVALRLAGESPWANSGAEFKITIPRAMALDIRTDTGGDLVVKEVEGDIEINNMNGSVNLEGIAGSAVINTMNGEVRAVYAKAPAKLVSITSMNGEVDLLVPGDTKANVRLRTHNGSILTDFGEDVLKTKSESKGGYSSSSASMSAGEVRMVADSARDAVRVAQDVALEVQRAVQEDNDNDDDNDEAKEEAAADAAPAPTASADASPTDAPHSPDAPPAPRAPHKPHAPHAPRAPRPPMPPITGGKLVSGTLNGGGVDIKISTMNGEIKLRESK